MASTIDKALTIFLILVASGRSSLFYLNSTGASDITSTAKVIEVPDLDASQTRVLRVIDGDTVNVEKYGSVRLVGYDTYELREPRGAEGRRYLESLCLGTQAYLDVDDLEERDGYGRTLGYLWCMRRVRGEEVAVSVQKMFLLVRSDLVKRPLHIPPDEHPYWTWTIRHTVRIIGASHIVAYNGTGEHIVRGGTVVLTGGAYKICVGTSCETFRLLLDKPRSMDVRLGKDTDGDGLLDAEEESIHVTDPLKADTDGDLWGDAADPWPKDPVMPNAIIAIVAPLALLAFAATILRKRYRGRRA